MRENNVRTHTDSNADASVELFTYDSEWSLVRWRARVIQFTSRVGGSTRYGSGLRGVGNSGTARCGKGLVTLRPIWRRSRIGWVAKITIGIASSCPRARHPRQVTIIHETAPRKTRGEKKPTGLEDAFVAAAVSTSRVEERKEKGQFEI